MLLKHFVDRYNIFFAYAPSRINKNIHTSAINFVMIALLILQLTLFFFSLLRYALKGVTIFALVGFCATLVLVAAQASFRLFSGWAPISYRVRHEHSLHDDDKRRRRNLHAPGHLDDTSLPGAHDVLLVDTTDSCPSAGVCCLAFFPFFFF